MIIKKNKFLFNKVAIALKGKAAMEAYSQIIKKNKNRIWIMFHFARVKRKHALKKIIQINNKKSSLIVNLDQIKNKKKL